MLPDGELHSSRPKVYRSRGGMICVALAFRGFIFLVAVLVLTGVGYASWQKATAEPAIGSWLTVAVCTIAALAFVVGGFSWARKLIGQAGQKLTLDEQGVSLDRDYECCRFAWGEIARVDRDDHLKEQNNRHGIVFGLIENYMGWLSRSSLTIHAADGRQIVVTPVFERYDELCGYVVRRQKRHAQNAAADD